MHQCLGANISCALNINGKEKQSLSALVCDSKHAFLLNNKQRCWTMWWQGSVPAKDINIYFSCSNERLFTSHGKLYLPCIRSGCWGPQWPKTAWVSLHQFSVAGLKSQLPSHLHMYLTSSLLAQLPGHPHTTGRWTLLLSFLHQFFQSLIHLMLF